MVPAIPQTKSQNITYIIIAELHVHFDHYITWFIFCMQCSRNVIAVNYAIWYEGVEAYTV